MYAQGLWAALGGVSALSRGVGYTGSSFLPSDPPASLDRDSSCFGGALEDLGGGEEMPFLLLAQCHSRCSVKWHGGTRRSLQA